jgi:histidinol-phosphate aminotransferase
LNNVRVTIVERERMRIEIEKLGWLEPLPSYTNFLLLRSEGRAPASVRDALAQRGILIRAFKSPRLADYVRITIGRPEQNQAVLAALRSL